MLEIIQIAVLSDNYVYLLHDEASNITAVVDPAVEAPVSATLEAKGWSLDYILNTHHHHDHVGANLTLKELYNCVIAGPKADAARIPGIDIALADGDSFMLGSSRATVFDVPGHTHGHIAWYFKDAHALFCGDTLFAMGCGRLFEGSPQQMLASLDKISKLPDDTDIYCAHEYTLANGTFALTVEPDNTALQCRMKQVQELRTAGSPTIPTTLAIEKATNPFLRASCDSLAANLGLAGHDRLEIFTKTRALKDSF